MEAVAAYEISTKLQDGGHKTGSKKNVDNEWDRTKCQQHDGTSVNTVRRQGEWQTQDGHH